MSIARVKASSLTQGLPKRKTILAGNDTILPGVYESIATVNGTGSSATLTFSSIPSTYTHIQIRGVLRSSSGSQNGVTMRFNSDSASNYARHVLTNSPPTGASASAVASGTNAGMGYFPGSSDLASVYGAVVLDVLDYTSTNKAKTVRNLFGYDVNGVGGIVGLFSSLWFATPAAITSITISATNKGVANVLVSILTKKCSFSR